MAKYLDATGLTHLIQKLKTIFPTMENGLYPNYYKVLNTSGAIPPITPFQLAFIDLSQSKYPAGTSFQQALLNTKAFYNFARWQGYIMTGDNTCMITPQFRTILGGSGTVLAANSMYRFEYFGYQNVGIMACGYSVQQRIGMAGQIPQF